MGEEIYLLHTVKGSFKINLLSEFYSTYIPEFGWFG